MWGHVVCIVLVYVRVICSICGGGFVGNCGILSVCVMCDVCESNMCYVCGWV